MISKIANVFRTGTIKDTSILFVGNALSSFFAIIFSVLVGRLLGPEKFGIVSGVIAFVAIVTSLGDLGLGASLLRYVSESVTGKKKKKLESLVENIFFIRVATTILFFAVFCVIAIYLSPYIFKYDSPALAIISAFAIASYLLFEFKVKLFQSKKKFSFSAFLLAGSNLIRIIFIIIFLFVDRLTILSTVLSFAAAPLIMFVVGQLKDVTRYIGNKKEIIVTFKKVGSFAGWMGANRFISSLGGRVDTLLLLAILTPFETGIYSAAKQLATGIPIVIGSFATVLAPRYASFEGQKLRTYFYKTIALSFVVVLGLLVGIVLTPWIISFFGSKYVDSTKVLQLLLVGYIPFVIATPAVNLLIYGLSKPKIITILTFVQIPFAIIGIVLLASYYTVMAPVYVNAGMNFLTLVVAYFYSYRYLKNT